MRFNEFNIIAEKINLGAANAKPGAPATKSKILDVPKGRMGFDVARMQKALMLLGYSLPKYGADGVRGGETTQAVKKFQIDNNLKVDGIPGPATIAKMNDVIRASNPDLVAELNSFKVTDIEAIKKRATQAGAASVGAVGTTASSKKALDFFISKGYTREQAAGIVGNLQAESGANLKIDALGDGGQAYGIAQWHPPRQANFKRAFGKDIKGSSLEDQLEFIVWELNNTEKLANSYLKRVETAEGAAAIFDHYYERSSGEHREKRIANAAALAMNKVA